MKAKPVIFYVSHVNFKECPPDTWNRHGPTMIQGCLTAEPKGRPEEIKVIEHSAYEKIQIEMNQVLTNFRLYLGEARFEKLMGSSQRITARDEK